jgi:hypothetical protein
MEWAGYILVKLIAYAGWSALGLILIRESKPAFPRLLLGGLGYGLARLGLGMAFGAAVWLFTMGMLKGTALEYAAIYVPLRVAEWFLLAAFIRARAPSIGLGHARVLMWVAGGIAVSFAADLASPMSIEDHFCVGRCLCYLKSWMTHTPPVEVT